MATYRCPNPKCGVLLNNPPGMAGQRDECPACHQSHTVPGVRRVKWVVPLLCVVGAAGGAIGVLAVIAGSSGDSRGKSHTADYSASAGQGETPEPDQSRPKFVDGIRMAAIVNYDRGLIFIPAIEDVQIGQGGKLPVSGLHSRKIIGCVDENGEIVGLVAKQKEHRVGGKIVATTTHVIEPIKDKKGAEYAAYVRDGRLTVFAARGADGSERPLYVVRR